MRQYREEIIVLIGANPGIRTVQIADQVNCEIDLVEASIEKELASGAIVKRSVLAPNNRKATGFWMASVAPLEELPAELVAELSRKGQAEVLQAQEAPQKPKTRVQIAIDFIAAQPNQIATGSELHRAMGLKPTETPSSFLQGALSDRRLLKEGKFWTIGDGIKPAPRSLVSKPQNAPIELVFPPAKPAPVAPPEPFPEVPAEVGQPSPAIVGEITIESESAPATPGQFRCALWSTGELDMERDGTTVLQLSPGEATHLRRFFFDFRAVLA